MNNKFSIRLISEKDAGEVLEIYKPYALHTIITFEYEPPTIDEFLQRIKANITDYPWLVCLFGNKIIGYAYAGLHRYRTAYQWSCESSVYLSPEFHHKGIASVLYKTLFSLLQVQGYINVYAGICLPNEKSVGLHQSLGFKKIGVYKKIGYKFDKWHDVEWLQLQLQKHIDNPPIPKAIQSIVNTDRFIQIFKDANESVRKIN